MYENLDIESEGESVNLALSDLEANIDQQRTQQQSNTDELTQLHQRIEALSHKMNLVLPEGEPPAQLTLPSLDEALTQQMMASDFEWTESDFRKLPSLSEMDVAVCGIAGMLSVAADVLLVGTPEIVKEYRGGYTFDGSVLTELLRKVGKSDGELLPCLQWFEDHCKTPYDISCKAGVVTPNNHRLRSLAHDPFFGLLFAVADILMGTTTCVNNAGALTILINPKPVPLNEKLLSVLYYFGHLISDVCTFRGVPVPGFFLTQFFADVNIGDKSIAEIAQSMYLDGYDLRHLLSMQTSVWVKDILLHFYLQATDPNPTAVTPIAQREKEALDQRLRREQLFLLANAIGITGNLAKFLAPPSNGNPCALNLPQWVAFAKSGLNVTVALTRDTSAEQAIHNRDEINRHWDELQLKLD